MSDAVEISGGWWRGVPQEDGMYHVLLNDGGQIITPWADVSVDSEGNPLGFGWPSLAYWRDRVFAWRSLPPLPKEFER